MTAELPLTWTRPRELVLRRIPISKIDLPPEYERKDLVEDDAVGKSIATNGVQQAVVVIPSGDRFTMVKGGRRLRIAEKQGFHDLPAIIDTPPAGLTEEGLRLYRNRLRSVLTTARQDLLPSQRASLIRQTMAMFGMNQKEVAALLGWDAGSITNWLAIEHYIPELVALIDTKETTMHHARGFDGLTPAGQAKVLRSLRREMRSLSGGAFHKLVRTKFGPRQHPEMYLNPAHTLEKMSRKQKGRKSKKRPRLTRDEKTALSQSVELAEIELEDLTADNKRMKRECLLAGPVLNAILRNKELREMLSAEMRPEIERFCEVY